MKWRDAFGLRYHRQSLTAQRRAFRYQYVPGFNPIRQRKDRLCPGACAVGHCRYIATLDLQISSPRKLVRCILVPSEQGATQAIKLHLKLRVEIGSTYDDLAAKYGRLPMVVSLEVVECVYPPRHHASTLLDLLEPGGITIISPPTTNTSRTWTPPETG